ncbi:phosphate signaling complex protein PhoU [Roseospirillum parvum]|uniref:Phosphate-specific transport system accessory protein PhoU n=1 Tax=Roseospirillum parvum TaxID=83401 RepID=A0A1G7X013_9PROT|nr:phosphate signaling complex protein PhoU [Roseospirillum parvum]SDG77523.1 phosphate transport system protein [Roseospirillum parvum]
MAPSGPNHQHTVTSFDDELRKLNNTISRMGGLAETQLTQALKALSQRDSDLASRVVSQDAQIDQHDQEVQNLVVRLLALRQPMADDLRLIVGALKVSADLERIGDYAANVAKRTMVINQIPPVKAAGPIPLMGRLVQELIKDVLDAYVERDEDKALDVWRRDEEVDEMHTSLTREFITYMMEDPRNITSCTHLMFIIKNIERIGDHATNIAETVHFTVSGRPISGQRPKGDAGSAPDLGNETA